MYSLDEKAKIDKKYRTNLFFFVFCLIFLLTLVVVTICLTSHKNYRYFEFIGGAFAGIFVFLSIFCFAKTMDLRRLKLHFESVLSEKESHIEAEVVSIGEKTLTLDDDMRVREITLSQEGVNNVYFLLEVFLPCELEEGKSYRFLLADRFIRGIENEL